MEVAIKLQNHKLVSDKKYNFDDDVAREIKTLLITLAHLNLYRYWNTSLMWVLRKCGNFGASQKADL